MLKFRLLQSWLPTGSPSTQPPQTNVTRVLTNKLISRKFEGLEAVTLLFCGGYGLLVAVFMLKSALSPLLLSLTLVALGLLRWLRPARSKLQWALDSVLAVMVVAALFSDSITGAGSGPYLFLVLLFAILFPLFMEASSAICFSGLLLLVYFAFGRSSSWAVPPMLFVLRGVLVAGMCWLSMRFGFVLRQAEEGIDELRRDMESGAYNEHGWLRYGNRLLQQCRDEGLAFSLVLLPMPQDWYVQIALEEGFVSPHPVQMRALKQQALEEIHACLVNVLPASSVVGRNARGDWVLLTSLRKEQVLNRLEQHLGRPLQLDFGPRELEMLVCLMPCIVECGEQETLLDLQARALDVWDRARATGAVDD